MLCSLTGDGGAISTGTGSVNITNSTISNNISESGGIFNFGTLNVTNSTITPNLAAATVSHGGGIANLRTLKVTNSTISRNSGGGIQSDTINSSALVKSSIIAMNSGGNSGPDVEIFWVPPGST